MADYRGFICNCLALFDWDGSVADEPWLELAIASFEKCRVVPDICSLAFHDEPTRLMPLANLKSELAKRSGLSAVQLFSTVPYFKQLAFGWRISAGVGTSPRKTMFFGWDDLAFPFELKWIREFLRKLAGICEMTYGIGYQRPFVQGPDLYAYGISAGLSYAGPDREESNRIALWMRERMGNNRHKSGMLRDVYRVNVLTDAHFRVNVDDVPLRQWIGATAKRGSLEPINDKVWLWHVPADRLHDVQTTLARAGRLICS
jgi:hypothetical protein